ncbi:MAG: hypothetical protein QG635_510 [Bacteroidota bacterium]|nr:hypothetical protein [Bacteroidota bacterium]
MKVQRTSHAGKGIFVADGEKVTLRLLDSALEVVSFFALEEYYEKYSDFIESKAIPENVRFTADKEIFEQIVGFRVHTGIMAIGRIPRQSPVNEFSKKIIALNGIIDSENVGAIVRNAAAFGFDSLIFDKATSSPYLRRAVRVSMGTIYSLKYHICDNLKEALELLRNGGSYSIYAAETSAGAISITECILNDKFCLVFGSEGRGIDRDILDMADKIVSIPISDSVPSINVAASSAIMMFYIKNNNL